eukprot:1157728-Pelagomonas_calceolata.AAC.9
MNGGATAVATIGTKAAVLDSGPRSMQNTKQGTCMDSATYNFPQNAGPLHLYPVTCLLEEANDPCSAETETHKHQDESG